MPNLVSFLRQHNLARLAVKPGSVASAHSFISGCANHHLFQVHFFTVSVPLSLSNINADYSVLAFLLTARAGTVSTGTFPPPLLQVWEKELALVAPKDLHCQSPFRLLSI